MSNVARVVEQLQSYGPAGSERLLPHVYAELRALARRWLDREPAGQTLEATELVHEAYLRLERIENTQRWETRGHFFAAVAESMRRILVENARRKRRLKHGADWRRIDLDTEDLPSAMPCDRLIALDDALAELNDEQPLYAQVVVLRYFSGMTVEQTAAILGISRATANRYWCYARAWLFNRISGERNGCECQDTCQQLATDRTVTQ